MKSSSLILAGSKQRTKDEHIYQNSTIITPQLFILLGLQVLVFLLHKERLWQKVQVISTQTIFWKDEAGVVQDVNVGSAAYHMQWSHWKSPYGVSLGVTSWEDVRTPESINQHLWMLSLLVKPKWIIRLGAKAVSDTMPNEYNI